MIRVRLNWIGASSGFSILHFNGEVSTALLAQDAADAAAAWWEEINDRFSTAQAMQVDPEVLEINPANGQTVASTTITSTAVAGTAGGTQVPQASMVLVRWRTGNFVNGREIRGRTFIPGLGLGEVSTTGELGANALADIAAASTALAETIDPFFAVYSPTNQQFASVESASVWTELAVMRSRRD